MRIIGVALLFSAGCIFSSAFVHPREWTRLILTHHWPETFCSMDHCKTNFSYWTLHGLWPNAGMMCNKSWHFNASLIEDIKPEMEKFWPDLRAPLSSDFWKYEWVKHGTCAAKAESINTEHKYFSKALELFHKFDLNSVLMNNKIVPSEEHYNFDDVEGAITGFYGVKTKIQCVHPEKGGKVQTLGQIEICVDRDFQLIDCEKSSEGMWSRKFSAEAARGQSDLSVCDHSLPVYYPPVASRT